MSTAPGSFLVLDPGRTMGFAHCLYGGKNLKHGTWRFNHKTPGEAYYTFTQYMRRTLEGLPDPLIVLELPTIVSHGDDGRVDAEQVLFTAGWTTVAQTLAHIMALREPDLIAIQTWRSKTHGKTFAPKELKLTQNEKSKWFKERAKEYCDKNGWSYQTTDEAESLCMLDAVRQIHEPSYAFDRGRAYQQASLL